MKLLRDKRELTKVLLLFELTTGNYSTFKSLAEKFDITIQAISDYFKIMSDEDLVQKLEGFYKPTPAGVEFLHDNFTALRSFVDSGIEKLAIITQTSAIAGNDIKKGERVGLFMENGSLVAYSGRRSSSTGTALDSASKDREIAVTELDGIVKLSPGRITIFRLPGLESGGSQAVDMVKLKVNLEKLKPDFIFIKGTTAEVTARAIDLKNTMRFAVSNSAVDAASVGMSSLIIASGEHVPELKLEIDKMNRELINKIKLTIVDY